MGGFIARWRGETWQALLSRESYGLHFSVSAFMRLPTDEECDAAFAGYKFGLWNEEHMEEITTAWQKLGSVNAFVRHFVPDEEARRMRELAGL